jgi:rhodanese-related sulfurtransferase
MRRPAWLTLLVAFPVLATVLATPSAVADDPVNITHDLPAVEVMVKGKTVRIERNPDPFNHIAPDYAMTSRPCPPFCIQPMQLAPGVETIGELEVLDYLQRMTKGDDSILLIDSRDGDWPKRSGIIPGAIVLPWDTLFLAKADAEAIANILEDRFGARRDGPLWSFAHAKTLVLYCNGPWCGQSPTNIRSLLTLGYPAHKLKWYRGGMQSWQSLGLTTVAP